MPSDDKHIISALAYIQTCTDPDKLRRLTENAKVKGEHKVRHAAELRLFDILPAAKPGTLEYDVWRSIYALEGALKAERGKTILLSRTRQKIKKDGEHKTVADLVMGKVSDGFTMLIEREMPELTFEAVALRHGSKFDDEITVSAKDRLEDANVCLEKLIQPI